MCLFLQESQAAQRQILMEFLKEARRNKREVVCVSHIVHPLVFRNGRNITRHCSFLAQQLEQLQKELNFLEEDIKSVQVN